MTESTLHLSLRLWSRANEARSVSRVSCAHQLTVGIISFSLLLHSTTTICNAILANFLNLDPFGGFLHHLQVPPPHSRGRHQRWPEHHSAGVQDFHAHHGRPNGHAANGASRGYGILKSFICYFVILLFVSDTMYDRSMAMGFKDSMPIMVAPMAMELMAHPEGKKSWNESSANSIVVTLFWYDHHMCDVSFSDRI